MPEAHANVPALDGLEPSSEAGKVEGIIFDIKRFAVHDGPGIRTTVFFKRCPLSCRWCHNPESMSSAPQLLFFPRNCIGCDRCRERCPTGAVVVADGVRTIARDLCDDCGECTIECYAKALVMSGRRATALEVVEEVERDAPFYENSGGGATMSGGEPFAQPAFLSALLTLFAERGRHTVVDTSGQAPFSVIEPMLDRIDMFLYDLKHFDSEVHREWTGVPNERILDNLERLAARGKRIVVRTPIIPGLSDSEGFARELARVVAARAPGTPMELLPYHRLGESKRESLGLPDVLPPLDAPKRETLLRLCEVAAGEGVECHVEM
jgi:pyruvate formate lyase activating enzyme